MSDFSRAVQKISKDLGKDTKIPEEPAALTNARKHWEASAAALRTDCESAISKCRKATSSLQSEVDKFIALIEKDDFHLDPKTQSGKIRLVRQVLAKVLEGSTAVPNGFEGELVELERHLHKL